MKSYLTYSVSSTSKKTLDKSSSGGVFYILAHYYIEKLHGVVYGATCDDGVVYHKRVSSLNELPTILKSKYVQSNIRNSFSLCAQDLVNGMYVLFVGTPCQIISLKSYLRSKEIDTNNLFSVDLFCHGVPKVSFWEQYLKENDLYGKNINVDFRYKKPSWENYSLLIKRRKKTIKELLVDNDYGYFFLKNYILCDGCYKCNFKGENRQSDLTIGDFWGVRKYYPELYNKNGVSLIVIRNRHGFVLDILSKKAKISEVRYSISLGLNPAYFYSVEKPLDYDDVVDAIGHKGFIETKKQIDGNKPKKSILKSIIKAILKPILKNRARPKLISQKLLIISDYGHGNFGNRLQNYALRQTLKALGYNAANLYRDENQNLYPLLNLWKLIRTAKAKKERCIKKASKKSGEINYRYDYSLRMKKSIKNAENIIVGSDQVWNWTYHKSRIPFNLAMLCTETKVNKITYAASFGIDYIDDKYLMYFKEALNDFSAISCREQKGVEILENLGFKSELVLDPTLLLNMNEWDDSCERFCSKKLPKSKYVLRYSLSSKLDYESEKYKEIKKIDILSERSKFYVINHFDFVNLIKNAKLIITDSFHALVFSIIYKKKIVLLPRDSMKSRMESLCNIIGIEYQNGVEIDLSNIDTRKLEELKKESINYLKNNLK